MYSMVILDDEKIVLQGIQKLCQKEDFGFVIKGCFCGLSESVGCIAGSASASNHYRCADASDGWSGICKKGQGNPAGERDCDFVRVFVIFPMRRLPCRSESVTIC